MGESQIRMKLKPCPKCGSEAEYIKTPDGKCSVICSNRKCILSSTVPENFFNTVQDAYSVWNLQATRKKKKETVEHPTHYNAGKVECIDAIESALGPEGFEGFLTGTVIKYLWRYKHKGGVEDLKKAAYYLGILLQGAESND